jgi:hypothetical protein
MDRFRRLVVAVAAASLLVSAAALAGCAPERTGAGASTPPTTPSATATPDASASPSATPLPGSTQQAVAMPTDCRAILSAAVLAQLEGVPLNDPAFGPSGVRGDSLVCIWGDPAADTTNLRTTIERMGQNEAFTMLNALADDEDFTCYKPDAGTRCEKQWPNENYPVTDGATYYWRDGVLIATQYSNLAPSGYTAAIVASVFGG